MDSKVETKRGAYIKVKGNLLFPGAFEECTNLAKTFIMCEDRTQSSNLCSDLLQKLKQQPLSFTFLFSQSCTVVVNPLADLIVEEEGSNSTTLELGYLLLNSGIAREAASSFFFKCFDTLMNVLHQHHDDQDDRLPLYAAKIMCTAIHIVDEVELVAKGVLKSNVFWHAITVRLQVANSEMPQGALVALLYLARQCLSVVPLTRAIIDNVDGVLTAATTSSGPFSNNMLRCLAALFIVVALSTEEDITSLSAAVPKLAAFTGGATVLPNLYMTTVFDLAKELVDNKDGTCFLRQINAAFRELKKRSFHTEGRLRSLERISGILFGTDQHQALGSKAVCVPTAAVVLVPGAIRALFSAICDVDEFTCGCSCDVFFKLLTTTTTHTDKGTADLVFSVQLSVVQSLIEMGIIYLLEDILVDYSIRTTVSVLSLLTALVKFSSVSKAAVTSSRCVQRVVHGIHQLAQKDNLEEYVQRDERSTQVKLYFELLGLTLDDEKTTVSENVLTDISTIISEAKSVPLCDAGMRTLGKLAAFHPMAASLILDFDFLNEKFLQDEGTPSPLHRMLVGGSFDIMTQMALVEDSVITFEWIETLLAAVKRVAEWGDAAVFASVWACVAKTLSVSEEAKEYMMDDETCDLLVVSVHSTLKEIHQSSEEYLPCLSALAEAALYTPSHVGERVLAAVLSGADHVPQATASFLLDLCAQHQQSLALPLWTTTLVRCSTPGFVVHASDENVGAIAERATALASSDASRALPFLLQLFEGTLQRHQPAAAGHEERPATLPNDPCEESELYVGAVDGATVARFFERTAAAAAAAQACNTSTCSALLSDVTHLLSGLPSVEDDAGMSEFALLQAVEMCLSSFSLARGTDAKAAAPLKSETLTRFIQLYTEGHGNDSNTASVAQIAQFCCDLVTLDFISEVAFNDDKVCKAFVETYVQPLAGECESCHSLILTLNEGRHK